MLTAKQSKLMKALFTESTITAAAKSAGISRKTAYEYMRNPEFMEEMERIRGDCLSDTVRYLQSKLHVCNETIFSIIEDPNVQPSVKVTAINSVYANLKSMTETADIMDRIDSLERLIEEGGHRWGIV